MVIAAAAKLQSRQQYVKNPDPAHSEVCIWTALSNKRRRQFVPNWTPVIILDTTLQAFRNDFYVHVQTRSEEVTRGFVKDHHLFENLQEKETDRVSVRSRSPRATGR